MEYFLANNIIKIGEIVSVYCDDEKPDTHLTGFLSRCDEGQMLIDHISPSGFYDGFILIHAEDIHRMDCGGKYEQKVEKLYQCRQQSHAEFPITGSLYASLLAFCQRERLILSAETEDAMLSGFLLDFDEDIIHLQVIDEYGEENGETIVRNDEIISFAVDTLTEQNIRLLYQQNQRE